MPKPETPKPAFIDILAIPKSKRGLKEIPKEWTELVQRTPQGKALIVEGLKYSTVQGRIHNLIEAKTLNETYKVMQRKVGNSSVVYIAHLEG